MTTRATVAASRRRVMVTAASLWLAAPAVQATAQPAPGLRLRALDDAQARLQSLPESLLGQGRQPPPPGLGATLVHLAQSVEYAVSGFPQPRSALFQHTVGALAFAVFDARGRMSHDLQAPIPGAPVIDPATPVAAGLTRLQAALARFRAHTGPLQPHFAYGRLDKAAYERAHAMHIAEHLDAWTAAARTPGDRR